MAFDLFPLVHGKSHFWHIPRLSFPEIVILGVNVMVEVPVQCPAVNVMAGSPVQCTAVNVMVEVPVQ